MEGSWWREGQFSAGVLSLDGYPISLDGYPHRHREHYNHWVNKQTTKFRRWPEVRGGTERRNWKKMEQWISDDKEWIIIFLEREDTFSNRFLILYYKLESIYYFFISLQMTQSSFQVSGLRDFPWWENTKNEVNDEKMGNKVSCFFVGNTPDCLYNYCSCHSLLWRTQFLLCAEQYVSYLQILVNGCSIFFFFSGNNFISSNWN